VANRRADGSQRGHLRARHPSLVDHHAGRSKTRPVFSIVAGAGGCVRGQLLHARSAGGRGTVAGAGAPASLRTNVHARHGHRPDGQTARVPRQLRPAGVWVGGDLRGGHPSHKREQAHRESDRDRPPAGMAAHPHYPSAARGASDLVHSACVSKKKSDALPCRLRTHGRRVLPPPLQSIAGRCFRFTAGRARHGRRRFSSRFF